MFRVWVWGFLLRAQGIGSRALGLGFRVQDSRFGVQGLGSRVYGLQFIGGRVYG